MAADHDIAPQSVLVSVHGIRTTGRWQKQLTHAAQAAGIQYRPLDFGYFMAWSLLLPWMRKSKIEWFHDECEQTLRDLAPGQRASIIAHSFGTYLLAGALTKYSDMKFDRVIFCGSIVREDYPWSTIIGTRDQVRAVLNEAGGKDFWASVVCWVVSDAGPTGVSGFKDLASGRVAQRLHAEHRHSDYFYAGNYEKVWIPFLKGAKVDDVPQIARPKTNWRFAATAIVLGVAIAVGTIAYVAYSDRNSHERPAVDSRTEQLQGSAPGMGRQSDADSPQNSSNPTLPPENQSQLETAFNNDQPDAGKAQSVSIGGGGFKPGFCEGEPGVYTTAYVLANTLVKNYPGMKIEVSGYTDSIEEDPDGLSACRAQRLYEYLRARGLSANQMVVHGYGASKPIDSNETEEGRWRNRRIGVDVRN